MSAEPKGFAASAEWRPRTRLRKPSTRAAPGTRPGAIGPPATGSLTADAPSGASTKSAARSRQDAMVERREATRVRKARDHGFHVAPFGAPLPSLGGKEKKEGAPAPTKQQ